MNKKFSVLNLETRDNLTEQRQTKAEVTSEFTKNTSKQTFYFDTLFN